MECESRECVGMYGPSDVRVEEALASTSAEQKAFKCRSDCHVKSQQQLGRCAQCRGHSHCLSSFSDCSHSPHTQTVAVVIPCCCITATTAGRVVATQCASTQYCSHAR